MMPEMCPSWFQGFNLAFQIIFLLITCSISFTAFRAYQFFGQEQHKYLSLGFGLFSLSYIAAIISNAGHLLGGAREIAVGASYTNAYLFLAGIMILLFAYLRIEQATVRAVLLILVFAFIAIFTMPGNGKDMIFHLVTAVLLLFIVGQLTRSYRFTCKRSTLFVTLGFACLTAGQLLLVFVGQHQGFFVAAALVTLGGFVSIAASRVVR